MIVGIKGFLLVPHMLVCVAIFHLHAFLATYIQKES